MTQFNCMENSTEKTNMFKIMGTTFAFLLTLALLPTAQSISSTDIPMTDPINPLTDLSIKGELFENRHLDQPLVIRNQSDVARYFASDSVDKVLKKVDFHQQLVLLFVWNGSGQDKLDYTVQEGQPETIQFQHRGGMTRDFRPHFRVYAIRNDVKCQFGDQEISLAAQPTPYVKVTVCGTLNSQIMAIGGETTGVQITAGEIRWELDFADPELRKQAEAWHDKMVVVTGDLNLKQGVEIPQRWIVTVHSLSEPSADGHHGHHGHDGHHEHGGHDGHHEHGGSADHGKFDHGQH